MSLVSEALKKAEREAVARAARERGEIAPVERPLQPYRAPRRGGSWARALALTGVAAGAAAVGLAAYFASRAPSDSAPAPPPSIPQAEGPAPKSPEPLPRAEPQRLEASPGALAVEPQEAKSQRSPEAETPRKAAAESPASSEIPRHAAASAPQTPAPQASAPQAPEATVAAPRAAPPARRDTGTFLRSAEMPDGSRLELGGIVYSETNSFAYLNGRLVGVGEFVLGRRVARIDRNEVELAGSDGPIRLRLKEP